MAAAQAATREAVLRYEQTLRDKISALSDNGTLDKKKRLLREMFTSLDTSKDATLTYEEFSQIGKKKLNFDIPEVRMQHWFTKYDVDGSGSLTVEEFVSGVIENSPKNTFVPKPPNLRLSSKVNGSPYAKFDEAIAAMKALSQGGFKEVDGNGNGKVSLAEVDMWVRGKFPILNNKKALLRAHKVACGNDGVVQENEFENLCKCIIQYNRIFQCFSLIDESSDKRIEEKEFVAALNYLHFVPPPKPAEAQAIFRSLDSNKSGNIMFDEFSEFFIKGQPAPW